MARAFTGFMFLMAAGGLFAQPDFPEDSFPGAPRELKITFFGHATFMITWGDTVIHVDPVDAVCRLREAAEGRHRPGHPRALRPPRPRCDPRRPERAQRSCSRRAASQRSPAPR